MPDNSNQTIQHVFSEEILEQLFAAVLVHDDYYPDAILPEKITLNYSAVQLEQCYKICLQLWQQRVSRKELQFLVKKIAANSSFTEKEKKEFKYIRAKFKHLRFAYKTCSHSHEYPLLFHWFVSIMGMMQDAIKNSEAKTAAKIAHLFNLYLTKIPYSWMMSSLKKFQPSSSENFVDYIYKENMKLADFISQKVVTGKQFHNARKIISHQVALYDNLKILFPSDYHQSISQYLSSINGLMGSMHDDLIIKEFNKTQDYHKDTFEVPEEIIFRLKAWVSKFQFE